MSFQFEAESDDSLFDNSIQTGEQSNSSTRQVSDNYDTSNPLRFNERMDKLFADLTSPSAPFTKRNSIDLVRERKLETHPSLDSDGMKPAGRMGSFKRNAILQMPINLETASSYPLKNEFPSRHPPAPLLAPPNERYNSSDTLPFGSVETGKATLLSSILIPPSSPERVDYSSLSRGEAYLKRRDHERVISESYGPRRSMDSNIPFRRGSETKILGNELRPIQEEVGGIETLKRAMSWPPRVESGGILTGYESEEGSDTAIFSIYLMKRNRRGNYDKRLIRFDGTLFICMSASTSTFRKTPVIEADLLDCAALTVKNNLQVAIREYYPAGSTMTSLAKCLISRGEGTIPDATKSHIFVPKWVIPVDEIVKLQIQKGNSAFKIFTKTDSYTFKAYSERELQTIKFLLESCMNPDVPSGQDDFIPNSDSVQVSLTQKRQQDTYTAQQRKWKNSLSSILQTDESYKPKITTIKSEPSGVKTLRGVVILPSTPKPKMEEKPKSVIPPKHSRFAKRSSGMGYPNSASSISSRPMSPLSSISSVDSHSPKVQRIRNSVDISAQIALLDEEIRMLDQLENQK